jgi:hypothetical protein
MVRYSHQLMHVSRYTQPVITPSFEGDLRRKDVFSGPFHADDTPEYHLTLRDLRPKAFGRRISANTDF